jgi:hypothetical protein
VTFSRSCLSSFSWPSIETIRVQREFGCLHVLSDDGELLVKKLERLLGFCRFPFDILPHVNVGNFVDLLLDAFRIRALYAHREDARPVAALGHVHPALQRLDSTKPGLAHYPECLILLSLNCRHEER